MRDYEDSGMYDIVMNKGEVAKATVKITIEEYVVSVSKKEAKKPRTGLWLRGAFGLADRVRISA